MKTRLHVGALGAAMVVSMVATASALAQGPPVTGRLLDVRLTGGMAYRGELIEVTPGSLLLQGEEGLRTVPLAEVARIRGRRHDFSTTRMVTWIAVGALVSGAGLSYACSQVEGAECGSVLPGVVLSWGLLGLPLAFGVAGSSWEDLPSEASELRAHARFPQGAPSAYRARPPGGGP